MLLRFKRVSDVGFKRVGFETDNPIAPKEEVHLDGKRMYRLWEHESGVYVVYETNNPNFYVFYLAPNVPQGAKPVKRLWKEYWRCKNCGSRVEWVDYEEFLCPKCGWEPPVEKVKVAVYEAKDFDWSEVTRGEPFDPKKIMKEFGIKRARFERGHFLPSGHHCPIFFIVEKEKEWPYPSEDRPTKATLGWGLLERSSWDEEAVAEDFGRWLSIEAPNGSVLYAKLPVSKEEAREALEAMVERGEVTSYSLDAFLKFAKENDLLEELADLAKEVILRELKERPARTIYKITPELVREIGLASDPEFADGLEEAIREVVEKEKIQDAYYATRLIEWLKRAGFEPPESLIEYKRMLEKKRFEELGREEMARVCKVALELLKKGITDPEEILKAVEEEADVELRGAKEARKAIYIAALIAGEDPEALGGLKPRVLDVWELAKEIAEILKVTPKLPKKLVLDFIQACREAVPEWADGAIIYAGKVYPLKVSKFTKDEYIFSRGWKTLTFAVAEKAGLEPAKFADLVGVKNIVVLNDGTVWRYDIVRDLQRKYTVVKLVEFLDLV